MPDQLFGNIPRTYADELHIMDISSYAHRQQLKMRRDLKVLLPAESDLWPGFAKPDLMLDI